MRRISLILFLGFAIVSSASAQTANTISTFAGGGTNTGSAISAYLPQAYAAVRDASGNTYISEPALGIVYKVNTGGTISTLAGTGVLGFSGDGGPATSAQLGQPEGLALDSSGNLYIADALNNRIRMVTPAGIITTLAGTGDEYNGAGFFGGYSGDGGPATSAFLNFPAGVAVDSNNNIYIADQNNNVVRVVNGLTKIITTFAGNGTAGYGGDTGAAANAELNSPRGVTVDSSNNVYIADRNNCIVRKVTISTLIITTYAGTPGVCQYGGDGGAATAADLGFPNSAFMDASGNLLIADTYNYRVRRVDSVTHDISTIAGNGNPCTTGPTGCGDGGAATSATLNTPSSVFVDSTGITLIADSGDMRIRTVSVGASPVITNYAGSGSGGDNGPATSAILGLPYIVGVGPAGNVLTLDARGERLRKVNVDTQVITTIAGSGNVGVYGAANGNNGPATGASFVFPIGMAIDGSGNIYIADQLDYAVWKISADSQNISVIAGNQQQCNAGGNPNSFPACGDGGPAPSASLCEPAGVAVDASGNVYISDQCLNRVRVVNAESGAISNFAGNLDNNNGFSGDGGPPTAALLNDPIGMAFSPAGDLYIADTGNNRIREVSFEANTINTYAFNGEPTFGGDGGDALDASMFNPTEVAFDAAGNLFVGGGNDNVVQRIDINDSSVITVAGNVDNLDGGFSGDGGPSTLALIENFGLAVDSNENLYIADAGTNRIRKVHMAPVAAWTPTSLTFPPTLQGQESDSQFITFTNTGLNDLAVNVVTVPTDYSASGCIAPPLESCSVLVSLEPAAGGPTGTVNGTLVLSTTDTNNPTVNISLFGTVPTTGFTLTVVTAGTGSGSVFSDPFVFGDSGPSYIECVTGSTVGCSGTFASGAVVTLTAFGSAGSGFTGWTGPCTPVTDTPYECTVTMSAAQSVTATFGTTSLTVNSFGNGTGVITSVPAGISCPPTCTAAFPVGTASITLTATANTGSVFVGWMDEFCTNATGSTCVIAPSTIISEQATAVFSVPRQPFTKGDVFVGSTSGMIFEYNPSGTIVQVLPSINLNSFGGYIFGMAFDANGNLYATNYIAQAVEKFLSNGTGPTQFSTSTFTPSPDSIRIDPAGDIFVGMGANSTAGLLLEFAGAENGAPTSAFFPAYQGDNGIGPFELLQDNATILYTGLNDSVYSFNIALGLQNPDFADNLPGLIAYDLRQLPDKTVLVANGDRVVRLGTNGAVTQTYLQGGDPGVALLLGLTLDADGATFWTDDSITGIVYRVNIQSGAIVSQFTTQLAQNSFGGIIGLGGIAVFGSPGTGGEDLTVSIAGTGTGSVASTPAGITCPAVCTDNFAVGTQVVLTATATGGSTFTGWSGNCTGTGTCTVTMSAAQAVTANFSTAVSFEFTYVAAGTGTGTVVSSPAGINCTQTCTADFASGTVVTLAETPASGSTFTGWSGACSGTGSCVVTMSSAETVTATFALTTFPLTVTMAGAGSGSVASVPSGITCPSTCSANFNTGTQVTLTATAGSGSAFSGWSGACAGAGTCTLDMEAAESVTATFVPTTNLTLTVSLKGTAYGGVSYGASSNFTCSDTTGVTVGTCSATFPSGTVVNMSETPGSGSVFGGWSGGGCTGTANTCNVTLTANTTVTATFNNGPGTFALSLSPAVVSGSTGNGTGTITSSPTGINCTFADGQVATGSGACSFNFPSGAIVNLTATAAVGSSFANWTGGGCFGTTEPCTNVMTSAVAVTVTFNAVNFALTVMEAGTGTGSVTSNPAGITCPSTCIANYPTGTQVTLTATAGANSVFAGWFGEGCTGTGTCTVSMTGAELVQATFNLTSALTVAEAGTGTGTVSSNPAGILCPSTCAANFTTGSLVTLTATAGSGSAFAGWSGSGCAGVGVCTVTMSAAESVTATFNTTTTFALTVTEAGTGTGTVTSSPAGINCTGGSSTGSCTANFGSEASVTLSETPGSGSTFAGWGGACTGTGSCVVTMSAAKSVTATFNTTGNFTLSVALAGSGAGSVTSSPAGINCGSGCSASFTSGTVVALSATPFDGSVFGGWGGACSGTGSCTVTMNAAESVTATFNLPLPSYTLTVSDSDAGTGTGTVTSSPAGINCAGGSSSGSCAASYVSGTVVTLTATPGSGSAFAGWSGACTGTGNCVVTMSAAESVVATFNTSTFTFAPGPTYGTSITTTPGGNIVVGFTLSSTTPTTVGLGCTSSAPKYLSCLITPAQVQLTGNGPSQVAIVLTSYCQGSTPGMPGNGPGPGRPGEILWLIVMGMGLCGAMWSYRGRRRWALSFAVMLLAGVGGAACGNLPQGTAGATPPGNYVLTVTATVAGQAPQEVVLNVNVQ